MDKRTDEVSEKLISMGWPSRSKEMEIESHKSPDFYQLKRKPTLAEIALCCHQKSDLNSWPSKEKKSRFILFFIPPKKKIPLQFTFAPPPSPSEAKHKIRPPSAFARGNKNRQLCSYISFFLSNANHCDLQRSWSSTKSGRDEMRSLSFFLKKFVLLYIKHCTMPL